MNTKYDEAQKLAERFKSVKNRSEFARTFGVPGGSAMIYQHINGLRPISPEAAKAYAKGFNCSIEEISPSVAETLKISPDISLGKSIIPVNRDSTQVPEGYTRFDIHDVEAHAGTGGIVPDYPRVMTNVDINNDWIRDTLNINPKNARPIPIHGDSMYPTLADGELAIYDRSVNFFVGDGVYVINQDDLVRVKRLQKMPGKMAITSDNKFYDTEYVLDEKMDGLRIVGKVAGVAGVRKI